MAQDLANPIPTVVGVVPMPEAKIREVFMAMDGINFPLAVMASNFVRSYVLAPVGFLILAPLFAMKFAPFTCKRYTLTNRRLLIQRGWQPAVWQEVPLAEIQDVLLDEKQIDTYFLSTELRIIGAEGKTVMTLTAVPEPAGFRLAILNARRAYGVAATKVVGPFLAASEAK
ncbi:MAG: PH domain-containing protein [Gemmataceae bacterium]